MSQTTSLGEGSHSPLRELAEQIRHLWWIPLLTGLVSIGLGLAILATNAGFRTGTSALGSGEFEAELAAVPPGDGCVSGEAGFAEDG